MNHLVLIVRDPNSPVVDKHQVYSTLHSSWRILLSEPYWFISAGGSDSLDCGQNYFTACSTFGQVMLNSARVTEGENNTLVLSVGTDTNINVTVPGVSEPVLIKLSARFVFFSRDIQLWNNNSG